MTTAPEGYELAPPQTVNIAEDGSTQVVFTVAASTVTLRVNTVDSDTNQPVPGACYTLDGEQQACDETASGQVVFEDVGGQDELSAYADATLKGGFGDGDRVQFSLVYEDGTYKIDGVYAAPPE